MLLVDFEALQERDAGNLGNKPGPVDLRVDAES